MMLMNMYVRLFVSHLELHLLKHMKFPRELITDQKIDLLTSSHVSTLSTSIHFMMKTHSVCVCVCVCVTDDETRVKLTEIQDEEGSDYINACWIDVSHTSTHSLTVSLCYFS